MENEDERAVELAREALQLLEERAAVNKRFEDWKKRRDEFEEARKGEVKDDRTQSKGDGGKTDDQ